mgnify:CR=1 FL=1|tara:strand:+ start:12 stop:689 length:678 start_codon:yes stop_codon:yes gene_type:complete
MKNKAKDVISAEQILQVYKFGIFPMAENRSSKYINFIKPKKRALLPIKKFHCSKSLKRFVLKKPFTVTINCNFKKVIHSCATINREETWINELIENKFCELHNLGYAHSIECWKNNKIVGGIYGISLGGCFFAESMFSLISNASKFALLNLVARLYFLNYSMLDVQFLNRHLLQFGAYEISQNLFQKKLSICLDQDLDFLSKISYDDESLFKSVLLYLHDIKVKS